MDIKLSIFLLLLVFAFQFKIDTTNKFILDKFGRHTVFHGVNVVVKLPPYIPKTDAFDPLFSLSDEDITYMKNMGFNLVRLGIIWESVERKEGEYDYDYLSKMKEIVNKLGENGIYSIIDAHQDVFARNFCGEGVPAFYTEKIGYQKKCNSSAIAYILGLVKVCKPMSSFEFRYDEDGLPLIEDCKKKNFVEYHFTPEMTSAYLSFYENKYNIQDKFAEFWKVVAKTFKGNDYVIGYDIWNEPFPGGLWDNLKHLIPGEADMSQLLPVYAKVDAAIREIDPNYILFFENMPFPDFLPLFGGLILGKFTKRPAGELNPQVYNVHNYCCLSGPNVCSGPEPDLKSAKTRCPKYHNKKIKKNLEDADELQVPLINSEFGACSDSEACYNEILGVVKAAEPNFVSWAYWMYKPFGDHTTSAIALVEKEGLFNVNGTIQDIKEKSLSRAYVQYYQGHPIDFNYVNDDTDFETSFTLDTSIPSVTRLYFNHNLFYKNGYAITVVNDVTKEEIKAEIVEVDNNYIDIKIDQALNGETIRIKFNAL